MYEYNIIVEVTGEELFGEDGLRSVYMHLHPIALAIPFHTNDTIHISGYNLGTVVEINHFIDTNKVQKSEVLVHGEGVSDIHIFWKRYSDGDKLVRGLVEKIVEE